jgi:hypothetical protein
MAKETIEQQIEELAHLTQRGFLDVQKGMATMDARLRQELATKRDLRETEERLLDAVRGTEVKRRDLEALADQVEQLTGRVAALEKTGLAK